MSEKKKCCRCGEEKPLEDFYKQASGILGRTGSCRICRRKKQSLYQKTDKGVKLRGNWNRGIRVAKKPIVRLVCECCGLEFVRWKCYGKKAKIKCEGCTKDIMRNSRMPVSLGDMSRRTAGKVLSRMGVGCALCGWNESSCDIHHILQKRDGGNNDDGNLVVLCPNHHRLSHMGLIDESCLREVSVSNVIANWRDYYNIRYNAM